MFYSFRFVETFFLNILVKSCLLDEGLGETSRIGKARFSGVLFYWVCRENMKTSIHNEFI